MAHDVDRDVTAVPGGRRARGRLDGPVAIVLGRAGAMACVLVSAPVIARALGPDGRGVTAAALAVLAVLPLVVGVGVPLAIRRRLAVDALGRADLVRTGRRFAALTALPSIALAAPLELLVLPELDRAAELAYLVSMALVPLTVSWAVDANVLLVQRRFRALGCLSVLQGAVSAAIVIAVWARGGLAVSTVLYAFLAGNVATFVAGLAAVSGRGGRVLPLRDVVGEGWSLVGGQLAEVFSARIGQILALPLVGAGPAGLYSVGVTTGSLGAPVGDAYANAAFARLADGADRRALVASLRAGAGLALLTGLGVAGLAWLGVPLVFGDDFTDARPLALLVALATACAGVAGVGGAALAARRQGHRLTVARAVGLAVGVVLLVPAASVGAAGVAGALAVGSAVSGAMILRYLGVGAVEAAPRPRDVLRGVRELLGRDR